MRFQFGRPLGGEFTVDDGARYGREILKAEVGFNKAAGLTSKDDRIPRFMKEEKLDPHGVVFDVPDGDLDNGPQPADP